MGRGGEARVYLGLVPRALRESPAAAMRSQDASDGWGWGQILFPWRTHLGVARFCAKWGLCVRQCDS